MSNPRISHPAVDSATDKNRRLSQSAALNTVLMAMSLAVVLLCGGWEWFAVGSLAMLAFKRDQDLRDPTGKMIALLPSFAWLGCSLLTGNRELYFPYTIYWATWMGLAFSLRDLWRGTLAGLVVIAVFLGVRIFQSASASVLLLEFGVALALLQFSLVSYPAGRQSIFMKVIICTLASTIAFASLSL